MNMSGILAHMFVSRTESHAHESLPVQKFVYLFLIDVVEKVQDRVVEPFGIGDDIRSRFSRKRARKTA
jgi:hypothetical protein